MKKLFLISLLLIIAKLQVSAEEYRIDGVYPSHWWVGMKNPHVQLMVRGSNVAENNFTISYPGVKLVKVHKVENRNYVFLDLHIYAAAKAGTVSIKISNPNGAGTISFPLKPRRPGNGTLFAQGVRSEDFIYLLMPDRFANGNTANDRIKNYRDQSLNRDSMYHRHGGDIDGVVNHLDYLQNLGVTTVWMTPILENDMPNRTEHGYAITDHYKVDERHGGNTAYHRLSDSLHKRGMKLVQDAVYNHCGLYHFFIQDMPMKDWVHQWPKYTNTTYKDQPLFDPYASGKDRKVMADGWFTREMPDLNQGNPFVANFLIQNAIWSVEEFGVDAWRIDTYIYNDLEFMNRCNKALMDEYPKITLFGETWVHGVTDQAYFTANNFATTFKSNLQGVTDFQTNLYGINPALTQNFGWTEGVNRLYQTLAKDFVYKNPSLNVNFLDNHDMSRFLSQVNDDVAKLKVGIGWLLTTRGIPQLYYGTEILLKGVSHPDGLVRGDFFGGWKEDASNKFTRTGRTAQENEVHDWTSTLAQFRKRSTALRSGKMMQYVPEDWVYTYFRYDTKQTVMIVMNTSADEKTVDPARFDERIKGFSKAVNVATSEARNLNTSWKIPGKSIWIMELK
jgi:neopullulanase